MEALVCDRIFSGRTVPTKDMLLEVRSICWLTSGGVLIVGGYDDEGNNSGASSILTRAGKWTGVRYIDYATLRHSMTRLPNNSIILTGGLIGDTPSPVCRIYTVSDNWWRQRTNHLNCARYSHSTVTLDNGTVMTAGGVTLNEATNKHVVLDSIEFLDLATMHWTLSTDKVLPRRCGCHCAVVLLDGNVLFIGGQTTTGMFGDGDIFTTSNCFVYKPDEGKFEDAAPMNEPRMEHAAVLIPDGNVLVTGGRRYVSTAHGDVRSPATPLCEIYCPATNTWTLTEPMDRGRRAHCSFLIPHGIMVVGGLCSSSNSDWELSYTAAVFDYDKKKWTVDKHVPRIRVVAHAACASFL